MSANRPGARATFRSAKGRNVAVDPTQGLREYARQVYVAKDRSLAALAVLWVRQVKLVLSQPGKGRVYVRTKLTTDRRGRDAVTGKFDGSTRVKARRRRFHRASAIGDPPAVDLGALRGSMDFEKVAHARYRLGTANKYAEHLEPPARLNRPFMRRALDLVRPVWGRRIVADLRDAGGVR